MDKKIRNILDGGKTNSTSASENVGIFRDNKETTEGTGVGIIETGIGMKRTKAKAEIQRKRSEEEGVMRQ